MEEIVKMVLREEQYFGTPVLTNVVSHGNKIVIKIENALTLQWLAKNAKTADIQHLYVKPVRVTAHTKATRKSVDLFCALKLFLNGTKHCKEESISIATSFSHVNQKSSRCTENGWVAIVSVFLKPTDSHHGSALHGKSYKMALVDDTESYRGLHDFYDKKNLQKVIQEDGSLIIGVSVVLDG